MSSFRDSDSPSSPPVKWTLEDVARKLANLPPPTTGVDEETKVSDRVWAYRQAAAVLSSFEPYQIVPLGRKSSPDDESAREQLLADSILVFDEEDRSRWTLELSVRRQALKSLRSRKEMQRALAANPSRPTDALQQMFEAYVTGQALPVEEQSLEQLSATLQVIEWLDDILSEIPSCNEVQRRIEQERILRPFNHLVGDHFRGRKPELQQLRDYVGVLPPDSITQGIRRKIEKVFSLHEKPPLLIHGPGGMGKSTLLAKFILEHAELPEHQRLPFAYLDFDRPGLTVQEPLTLLLEAIKQLGSQYPRLANESEELRKRWLERLLRAEAARPTDSLTTSRSKKSASRVSKRSFNVRNRRQFLDDFKWLIDKLKIPNVPLLLVLDTFEEVQYRSRSSIEELWRFLADLQKVVPRLRTVLAGRAVIRDFETQELELLNLDAEAAQGFLSAHGINDAELAKRIIGQVGGNPLSLRLAAEVLRGEEAGSKGIEDLTTRRLFFFQLQDNLIQGQLYKRILEHVHNPQVRKLAHPGLVLRRVTPELILHVLSEPCGVEIHNIEEAQALFSELQKEVSLVTPAEDGALRHRPDVRRVMIELLRRDEPQKVMQIHKSAAEFYAGQEGVIARAEEIYHLLSLGVDTQVVDGRWMEGVEAYLDKNALMELPPVAQTYLASRIGVELDEEVWQSADLESWERHTEREVRELIEVGEPQRALELLRRRSERTPTSPLYFLEARVLAQLGQFGEVEAPTAAAMEATKQTGDLLELVKLLMFSAEISEARANYAEARRAFTEAEMVAEQMDDSRLRLMAILRRIRLERRLYGDESVKLAAIIVDLHKVIKILERTSKAWFGAPELYRMVAGELHEVYPEYLRMIVQEVGFGHLDSERRERLAEAFASWETELSPDNPTEIGHLAQRANLEFLENHLQTWRNFVRMAEWAEVDKVAMYLIGEYTPPPSVTKLFAAILRGDDVDQKAESENALTGSDLATPDGTVATAE